MPKTEHYIWQPGETPIFTELLHKYKMGVEQNWRLWSCWESRMWKRYDDEHDTIQS